MDILHGKYGIIPACDLTGLKELVKLVKETCSLDFIQAYKIGVRMLALEGAKKIVQEIRRFTDLPIIYDHQKYGTDIPDLSGGDILESLKNAGIDGLIIFPFAGIRTLKATVEGCRRANLLPIVGGEMTHPGFLVSEGGYIADSAPAKIYRDAAHLGVDTFVVPGTKINKIKEYAKLIGDIVPSPRLMFPGVGKGQSGDIAAAFKAALPYKCSAIVGRGIYAAPNIGSAAAALWERASSVL
ncbi:MAG: orotidine 5'-phosphate decarboxylase / HUMPS family protein [Thermodesulfobacteriota bacterium]